MRFTILIFLATVAGSTLLTGLVLLLAGKYSLLDIPNQRSSHVRSTPRGGGLAIVIAFLAGLFATGLKPQFVPLAAGAGLVASIGLWDDIKSLPARWRLLVHLLAAVLLVWGGADQVAALRPWQGETVRFLAGPLMVLTWSGG